MLILFANKKKKKTCTFKFVTLKWSTDTQDFSFKPPHIITWSLLDKRSQLKITSLNTRVPMTSAQQIQESIPHDDRDGIAQGKSGRSAAQSADGVRAHVPGDSREPEATWPPDQQTVVPSCRLRTLFRCDWLAIILLGLSGKHIVQSMSQENWKKLCWALWWKIWARKPCLAGIFSQPFMKQIYWGLWRALVPLNLLMFSGCFPGVKPEFWSRIRN